MMFEQYEEYFGLQGGGHNYYIHKTKMQAYLDERQSCELGDADLQWEIAFRHADYVVNVKADTVVKKLWRVGDILHEVLAIKQL